MMFASALDRGITVKLDITAFIFMQISIADTEGSTFKYTTVPRNLSARYISIQHKLLIN